MIKILLFALLLGVLVIFMKPINGEFALLITIIGGVILIFLSSNLIRESFSVFDKIYKLCGVDGTSIKLIIKVLSISFLVEFTASIMEDFGLKSISDKLIFIGKLSILIVSAPIFYKILEMVGSIL